jgi:hypothetical protein
MIDITIFKNRYDNKTHKHLNLKSFDELEQLLYGLSIKSLKGKEDAYLISPASYVEDSTRRNDNVLHWGGWCAVDVDDLHVEGNIQEYINDMFPTWRFICYSTASSTTEQPKFRVVFALSRNILADEIVPFWHALQMAIGKIGDEQTKDKSRMYYIPGNYENANNFIFSGKGKQLINPDLLISKYPYTEKKGIGSTFLDRLPDEWRNQIIEYRKNKSDNTNFNWSSYKDCPFWPSKLANEYIVITGTGWYRKMYQIMVATAGNAIKRQYPISAKEIAELCKQFDMDTGRWYESRPLESEADRAIEYVYRNM